MKPAARKKNTISNNDKEISRIGSNTELQSILNKKIPRFNTRELLFILSAKWNFL